MGPSSGKRANEEGRDGASRRAAARGGERPPERPPVYCGPSQTVLLHFVQRLGNLGKFIQDGFCQACEDLQLIGDQLLTLHPVQPPTLPSMPAAYTRSSDTLSRPLHGSIAAAFCQGPPGALCFR